MLGVLVLLVASAVAQDTTMKPAAQPCCTSTQFTTSVGVTVSKMVNGKGVAQQGTERFVFDYPNQLLYVESSLTDALTQNTTNIIVLQDFKNMKQYITMEDGSCIVLPWMETMASPCIPDNATSLGEVTVGAGVKGNAFEFMEGAAKVRMVVTADTCTPIIDSRVGRVFGEDQQRTQFYYNFTGSISDSDRSMLTVPASCMEVTPKPCCTSSQFSASVSIIVGKLVQGKGVSQRGMERIQYDYTNKMIYAESSLTDQMTQVQTNLTVLQDYNNMKQYITMGDGSCYVQPWMEAMIPPCIPDNATFVGSVTLGEGAGALKGNAFRFMQGQAQAQVVVSADTCTPITDARGGFFDGEQQQRDLMYYNFQSSIADMSKFVVPANCDTPLPTMPPVVTAQQGVSNVATSDPLVG